MGVSHCFSPGRRERRVQDNSAGAEAIIWVGTGREGWGVGEGGYKLGL